MHIIHLHPFLLVCLDNSAKESSKGSPGQGRNADPSITTSSAGPKMVEIQLGFEYQLVSAKEATNEDYAELAKTTSRLLDFQFRSYFMDEEDVAFLSTEKLAIYEVKTENHVIFTIATYFDGDYSIPSAEALTEISIQGMAKGSSTSDYYLYLLQQMDVSNPFQSVSSVSLYSQYTSALTGPEVGLNDQSGDSTNRAFGVFKVVVPIVLLLVGSIVVAMIYMSWVESQSILLELEERKEEHQEKLDSASREGKGKPPHHSHENKTDGNRTITSDSGMSSLQDSVQDYDDDDETTTSEYSARFLEDGGSPARPKHSLRVSPRLLYRSFVPTEISSRVDFEEIPLHDHDANDGHNKEVKPVPPKPTAKEEEEEEEAEGKIDDTQECQHEHMSMIQVMDNFAQALNSASSQVNSSLPDSQEVATEDNIAETNKVQDSAADMPRTGSSLSENPDCHGSDEQTLHETDSASEQVDLSLPGSQETPTGDISSEPSKLQDMADASPAVSSPSANPDSCDSDEQVPNEAEIVSELDACSKDKQDEVEAPKLDASVPVNEEDKRDETQLYEMGEDEEVVEYEEVEYAEEIIEEEILEPVATADATAPPGQEHETKNETSGTHNSNEGDESTSDMPEAGELAGGNLRDFWEKKSNKQESNLREFWEQKSKGLKKKV